MAVKSVCGSYTYNLFELQEDMVGGSYTYNLVELQEDMVRGPNGPNVVLWFICSLRRLPNKVHRGALHGVRGPLLTGLFLLLFWH